MNRTLTTLFTTCAGVYVLTRYMKAGQLDDWLSSRKVKRVRKKIARWIY
ncbi:DUF3918 family protein [Alkalihalobacillus sp. AL-G]|nr:DUF3918 family protein [Alkalihalobacillus sp. AL-G]WLD92194.1 DUF3918 family protein [Alkalihalobacillus sp. AL-G]